MTPEDFLIAVNDELRGIEDDAPDPDSDDGAYWLRIASRIRRSLYRDTTKQWDETWQEVSLGTVAASTTPEYEFADGVEFLGASNAAYVLTADGDRLDYDVVKPQNKSRSTQQIYIAGQPQKVYFNKTILADDKIVGGELILPGFVMPADITAATETIIVNDIDWLTLATAAVIAFGDITYEDKVADLNGRANVLYKTMVRNNRRGNSDSETPTKTYTRNKIRSRSGR
jgi:hypothetical protein